MSQMPSEPYEIPPQAGTSPYPDVPMQDIGEPAPVTGRTLWDLVAGKGLLILGVLIAIAVAALIILNRDEIDWEQVKAYAVHIVQEYWYVAVGPVLGYALGKVFARMVHRPIIRVVISVDVENHIIQALLVPEEFFRFLNQTGNNVVYHSPRGNPVYIANRVDLDRCFIDYGWAHRHNALVVFAKERFYVEWKDALDQAMADSLNLMDNPEVYGMQFAGEALKRHLDRTAQAVGVQTESPGGPFDYREREPEPDQEEEQDDI